MVISSCRNVEIVMLMLFVIRGTRYISMSLGIKAERMFVVHIRNSDLSS